MLVKKHYTQLTNEEKTYIEKAVKEMYVSPYRFSKHAFVRQSERQVFKYFTIKDFTETLQHGRIIEFIIKNNDIRILVRSNKVVAKRELVFSYSIKTKTVVTTWMNMYFNQHSNVVMDAYTNDIDVIKTMKRRGL